MSDINIGIIGVRIRLVKKIPFQPTSLEICGLKHGKTPYQYCSHSKILPNKQFCSFSFSQIETTERRGSLGRVECICIVSEYYFLFRYQSEVRCFLGIPNFGQLFVASDSSLFSNSKISFSAKIIKGSDQKEVLQFSLPFQTSIIHRFKCQNISKNKRISWRQNEFNYGAIPYSLLTLGLVINAQWVKFNFAQEEFMPDAKVHIF